MFDLFCFSAISFPISCSLIIFVTAKPTIGWPMCKKAQNEIKKEETKMKFLCKVLFCERRKKNKKHICSRESKALQGQNFNFFSLPRFGSFASCFVDSFSKKTASDIKLTLALYQTSFRAFHALGFMLHTEGSTAWTALGLNAKIKRFN